MLVDLGKISALCLKGFLLNLGISNDTFMKIVRM
jgi:hypothetical protein